MNRALKVGGSARTKGSLGLATLLCLLLAASASASAQSSGSSATNPPAQMPATTTQPLIPPPANAPDTLPPATPSMMPRVPGTQLDRVVAIVNDDLILDSDVNEEMRLQAFDPYHSQSEKLSPTRAIERLINRTLILQQLKLQTQEMPTDTEVNNQIDQLRKDIPACSQYHCQTKEGWDHFLADQGFTEASFFARWKDRMMVLSFIEERFQMGINIKPEQIQSYYDNTLLPEYQRQHATAPKLDAISNQIREVLLQQQISNLLQDWLKSLRAQGSVVVLHPGEEAP
jgi:peptidyl-prolyl cis-trans isomerase SurA